MAPQRYKYRAEEFYAQKLVGRTLPAVRLPSTIGDEVDLSKVSAKWIVFYSYPGDGIGVKFPSLRGCTPEACGFRDLYSEFTAVGASLFGISTQTTSRQSEFVRRNDLQFPILSDSDLSFARALELPTLVVEGETVLDRLTLISDARHSIQKVYAVIADPETHPVDVLNFLRENASLNK